MPLIEQPLPPERPGQRLDQPRVRARPRWRISLPIGGDDGLCAWGPAYAERHARRDAGQRLPPDVDPLDQGPQYPPAAPQQLPPWLRPQWVETAGPVTGRTQRTRTLTPSRRGQAARSRPPLSTARTPLL